MILLWGSNARETHPIFFHHVLKAIHNGARLVVIDPRRSASAQWADLWLGLDVGGDIALANAVAREIIHEGLADERFIANATSGYEEYAASVEPYTLEEGERLSGVPASAIRELAHAYGRADRAILCWTLGITEHHNATDNVLALINLALLTGHVGKYGSGLNPLRGQNNVQGGGDMGAIPNKLPGFQDIEKNAEARARFEEAWGVPIIPHYGWHLTQMFEAMDRGELRTLYVIGENPARLRSRPQARDGAAQGPGLPRRAGHRADAHGQARRRGAAGVGVVGRGRRHRDQLRAPRAAVPQGARPARRGARRHLDHRRARQTSRVRLG